MWFRNFGRTLAWALWSEWVFVNTMGCTVGWCVGMIAGFAMSKIVNQQFARFASQNLMLPISSSLWYWRLDFWGLILGWISVGGIVTGIALGIGQWLVLRRYIQKAGLWVAASALSLGMILILGQRYMISNQGVGLWIMAGAVVGGIVGLGQWLVLRQQVQRSEWWVLTSAAALAASLGTGSVLFMAINRVVSLTMGMHIALSLDKDVLATAVKDHTLTSYLFYIVSSPSAIASLAVSLVVVGAIYGVITGLPLAWLLKKDGNHSVAISP